MFGMPFENKRDDIISCIRIGLRSCRTSPKAERNEWIRTMQAEAIFMQLERCGYRIVRTDEDPGIKALKHRGVKHLTQKYQFWNLPGAAPTALALGVGVATRVKDP